MEAGINTASTHVEAAKPHSDAIGRIHLDSASTSLLEASVALAGSLESYTELIKGVETVAGERDSFKTDLTAERDRFFSHKQRAIGYWVGGGILLLIFTGAAVFIIKKRFFS